MLRNTIIPNFNKITSEMPIITGNKFKILEYIKDFNFKVVQMGNPRKFVVDYYSKIINFGFNRNGIRRKFKNGSTPHPS